MSVIDVSLHWSGSTGGRKKGSASYVAVYRVRTDSHLDQVAVICDHFRNVGNLPYIGSPYQYGNDNDPSAICNSIDPSRQPTSAYDWEVTLTYDTPEEDKEDEEDPGGGGDGSPDPKDWRERWDKGSTVIMVPAEEATFYGGFKGTALAHWPVGKVGPMINSAFVPFVPPSEKEVHIGVYRRSFYAGFYSSDFANAYEGRVNKSAINIVRSAYALTITALPAQLKIASIGASLESINNYLVWNWTIEFWINPLGWRVQVVDRGKHRAFRKGGINPLTGSALADSDIPANAIGHVAILDPLGVPLSEDVLLDGDGQPLCTPNDEPKPVYLTYGLAPEVDIPGSLFGMS